MKGERTAHAGLGGGQAEAETQTREVCLVMSKRGCQEPGGNTSNKGIRGRKL